MRWLYRALVQALGRASARSSRLVDGDAGITGPTSFTSNLRVDRACPMRWLYRTLVQALGRASARSSRLVDGGVARWGQLSGVSGLVLRTLRTPSTNEHVLATAQSKQLRFVDIDKLCEP